jgi:hypothetical protein
MRRRSFPLTTITLALPAAAILLAACFEAVSY